MPAKYLGNARLYKILFNGGHPYTVRVTDLKRGYKASGFTKVIDVLATKDGRAIMTFFAKKLFIGSGKNGKNRGNSLLAYVGNYRYISLSMPIVMFQTNGEYITRYWSSVGKSAVSYPVAVGTRNVFYNQGWKGFTKIRKDEFRTNSRQAYERYRDPAKLPRVPARLLDDSEW